MITFFKLFFIFLFFSSSVYSANSKITPLTELDCDTEALDDGSAIKKCKIKNVNRDNIPFSTTEQDVIKCWANKPLADLYTVEMYFSFDLDNKDMTPATVGFCSDIILPNSLFYLLYYLLLYNI